MVPMMQSVVENVRGGAISASGHLGDRRTTRNAPTRAAVVFALDSLSVFLLLALSLRLRATRG
jgi:hypothetical protein